MCNILKIFLRMTIDIRRMMCYNKRVRQRSAASVLLRKERRKMEEMTNAELNTLLELLAQLIEAKAKTPAEAAEIVRKAKTA